MSYRDKYIKYKFKYLDLKNELIGMGKRKRNHNHNPKDKKRFELEPQIDSQHEDLHEDVTPIPEVHGKQILLMFLGGTPTQENIIKHYENMNDNFVNKNNFHIVTHPIKLPFIINERFSNIFKRENIYIINSDHHIPTGWATKSLVYATLLMMQYAHTQHNNLPFDKYILLSSACTPLYTFDHIYEVLGEDEKSWLNTSPIKDITNTSFISRPSFPFIGSQWMILDKQHIKFLFPLDEYSTTYVIDGNPETCNNFGIIQSGKIRVQNTSENEDLNDLRFHLLQYTDCEGSDEAFFCNIIMFKLYKQIKKSLHGIISLSLFREAILSHIKSSNLISILSKLLTFDSTIIDEFNQIDKANLTTFQHVYPISVGDVTNINLSIDDDILKTKNYITFIGRCNLKIYDNKDIIIRNININYYDIGIEENQENPHILNQSTYCDWFGFNIDPSNFLRNFNITSLNINTFLNDSSFYLDGDKNIQEKIKKNMNNKTCDNYLEEKKLFHRSVLNTVSHPVEYSTWTFLNLLNAFILALYFKCSLFPMKYSHDKFTLTFDAIYKAYEKIICKIFDIINLPQEPTPIFDLIYNKVSSDPNILNIKIGTPITSNILLAALSQGSLFIRKCLDTSMIETYSNVLKKCKYNLTTQTKPFNILTQSLIEPYDLYS